jgi:acetylornithine/N-succinyldiaminopimelate aminotransferase
MQMPEPDPYLSLTAQEIAALEQECLFPTYKRYDLFLARGAGAYVYDLHGRRYLDMLAGIAVNALGYDHPRLTRVLSEQAHRLVHCSNLFYHQFQGALARRLTLISGMARAFFTNSGTEAIEGALKIARAHARAQGRNDKTVILALKNAFHGRTLGALSITAQEKYQAPFRPLLPDVAVVEGYTVEALEQCFSDRVCAVVLEPIQGEAGIVPLSADLIQAARSLCDRHGALLVIDEIQSGMGRTGKYFAYQHYGIRPDLVTVAKSLAGGYPLGVVLGSATVADSLKAGEHGTTFGGGPLACRLALEVLDVIEEEQLLQQVRDLGDYLMSGLRKLAARHPVITDVRGMGLMVGAEMGPAAKEVVQRLLEKGVIANAAHDSVLRLLPPYIVTREDLDSFLGILDGVLSELEKEKGA